MSSIFLWKMCCTFSFPCTFSVSFQVKAWLCVTPLIVHCTVTVFLLFYSLICKKLLTKINTKLIYFFAAAGYGVSRPAHKQVSYNIIIKSVINISNLLINNSIIHVQLQKYSEYVWPFVSVSDLNLLISETTTCELHVLCWGKSSEH